MDSILGERCLRKKAKFLILISLIFISVTLLLTAFDYLMFVSPSLVAVEGMVADEQGKPVAGAEVKAGNCTTYTDQNGNFILKIAEGIYNLTIRAKDYQTLNTLLNAAGQVKNRNFTLSREKLAELEPSGEKLDFNRTSCISNETKISVDSPFCECENKTAFLFLIRECTNTSYLRVLVGELYENGVWSLPEKPQVLQYTCGNIDSNITGYMQKYQVNFEVQPLTVFGGFIPSAQNPYYISSDHSLVYYINQQIFFSEYTFTSAYNITYTHYDFDLETLKDTDVSLNTNYLAVPPELLEKLKPLALNITSNLNSPFEKLSAIEDYLRNNYKYDLNYTRAPTGIDPVEWFLFHSKKGVCTHFNSAFVLLARSIGFPARLVAGYLINPSVEYQIVKPKQRHAYAEVLFENLGWITFDATAPCNCYKKAGTPTLKIVYPSQGAYISSSKITIAGEAYGFYKNAELYVNHTGFSLTFWDGDFAFDNSTYTQDGELTIEVSISDAAGNKASDSVKFTVDNTPPKVFISFPSNGTSIASPTIYVNGTIQELNKGDVEPSINDTRFTLAYWNASTGAFSFINQTNISGEVNVEVSFVDLAGNVGSNVVSFTVKSEVSPSTHIPTQTNITSCSSNMALKGSALYVEGSVFDANGNPVSNLNVVIYIAKDKSGVRTPIGTGKVVDGYFNITCYISKEINVGDYILIAETIGDDRYEGSRSDPPLKVLAETVVELSSPDRVIMGRGFTVNGTLKEKLSGQPIVNETVCITINSKSYLLTTDNQGGIIISNVALWQPGNYTVTLAFNGSDYYLSGSCSKELRVLAITISPTTNETFIRGEPASISGRVYAEDMPLDFESLTIKFDENTTFKAQTNSDGYFNITFNVPESQALGETSMEYLLEYYSVKTTQKIKVMARTIVRCMNANTLKPEEPLNITASLTDNLNQPVANTTVKLEFSLRGENETFEKATNNNGVAEIFNVTIPKDFSGNLTYTATFEGNAFYLPSFYEGSINVISTSPNTNMLLFLFAGLPIPAVIISAYIWRKKKATHEASVELEKGEVGATPKLERSKLSIEFPQIHSPFPLVWGVEEPLEVKISLNDPSNHPISSAIVKLNVDKLGEKKLKTSEDGKGEATYIFNEKGTYKINASFKEDGKEDEITADAEVRIVDYKEEVVKLFNSFYMSAKEKFKEVGDEMTPREMQSTLMSQVPQVKHKSLDAIISIFEVADYSLHPVTRKEYEQMYLSINEFWS
jgi:transglutaminase-like putative cysteine protease